MIILVFFAELSKRFHRATDCGFDRASGFGWWENGASEDELILLIIKTLVCRCEAIKERCES